MDNSLYTNSFTPIELDDSLTPALREALQQLATVFPDQIIRMYYWNEHHIAVSVTVHVNLPSRGPVDGVDIRDKEPIILVFHRDHYPYQSPMVFSDRLDFPRNQLPHLNPVRHSHPISLCLYRGNLSDWMADHTIVDLVKRVRQWFLDAARNRLIPPGDGWEAIRIDDAIGIAIYSPLKIQDYIQEQWSFSNGRGGFSILRFRLLPHTSPDPIAGGERYAIELLDIVEAKKADKVVMGIEKLNQQHNPHQLTERHLLGILLWPASKNVCDNYFGDIPSNLAELLQWEATMGLPISKALRVYVRNGYQFLGGVPVVIAIERPTNLIGKESDIELLNLVIAASEQAIARNSIWNEDATIHPLRHRTPLDTQMALEVSQAQELKGNKLMIFGCGAVGSKLVMHLARAGCTELTLVDYDELSPHNLVRHALLANSVGRNKAFALSEEIKAMFREKLRVDVIESNGISVLMEKSKKRLRAHKWLVDTTASGAFLRAIIDLDLPDNIRVMHAELAFGGVIGILSIEGNLRNPRMDDTYAYLFDLARTNTHLSKWLQEEQTVENDAPRFEEISIGMGCHTDTMRLADDVISFHAALFSTSLSKQVRHPTDMGYMQVSFLSQENDISNLRLHIPKFLVRYAQNDPEWEVRIADGVKQKILGLVTQSGQNETGGILIGRINSTRKTIHVTEALPPPPDSRSTPYMFVRGIADVWDSVKQIMNATGGYIYYVGEWHSHPMGAEQMSQTDMQTARQLHNVLQPASLPTHIMIATSSQLVSYVYSGNEGI